MSMHNTLSQSEREKALDQYIRALDRGDMDEISRVLGMAELDAELDRLITDLHIAYEAELVASAEQDTRLVRSMLEKHFGDAIDEGPRGNRALTVGDVAARLEGERQVPASDIETNRRLLTSTLTLPGNLGTNAIRELSRALGATASERYWRAFRNTAITMQMAAQQGAASELAAARQQKTGRKGKDST